MTHVRIFKALPQIAAQPDTKEVTVGSTAIFPCIATGYPVPNITWSKVNLMAPKYRKKDFQEHSYMHIHLLKHLIS